MNTTKRDLWETTYERLNNEHILHQVFSLFCDEMAFKGFRVDMKYAENDFFTTLTIKHNNNAVVLIADNKAKGIFIVNTGNIIFDNKEKAFKKAFEMLQ